MPRIAVWNGSFQEPVDFCSDCWPKRRGLLDEIAEVCDTEAEQASTAIHKAGEDGEPHPAYSLNSTRCFNCNSPLTDDDE